MRKLLIYAFCIISVMTIGAAHSDAQSRVSGTVKDQNDTPIVGAKVFLLNTRTRMERVTTTDGSGNFSFENSAPGEAQVRVAAQGFGQQIISLSSSAANSGNLGIVLAVGVQNFTVTAETGREERIANVPQPINIITSGELSERSTSTLSEIGREEAGLNVQTTSPTIGAIVVRGLTGKNVVNFVDGIRYTNSAQRGGINTFFNLNEPSSLESVEVLRGSNSAQYGSDSLGGTVNLLTKSPIVGGTNNEFHGEVNPFYNSADRSFGSNVLLSYGNERLSGYVNLNGRRINTLRTANGLDSHSAVTRFLGLPSSVLYDRSPNTEFTQYGGAARINYNPTADQQLSFFYQRSQQDEGKRFDQLLGGDGNLLADLRNLMLDFGYLRYTKANLGFFDSGSFAVSYNSQREERVNQGGQGNPFGDITNQPERTTSTGFNFFLSKELPARNSFLFGGDFYHERFKSIAFTTNPVSRTSILSRPRIPNNVSFDSGGLYIQDAWDAIPDRLRVTGALRYSAAFYKARAEDSPLVAGRPLFQNDSLRVDDFSGRIGAVVRVADGLRLAFNYSRGFRYPSATDLGTLGLTGDGFEVDYLTSINLGGTIGTTAGTDAVSTGLPVAKQRSEYSNNFDASIRYSNRRIETAFTAFRLDIEDAITKQALILPLGAVGQRLGDQTIISQLPNGVVFVPAATNPVLVRSNFTAAKIYGIEYEAEARLSDEFQLRGNFTYIRAADKQTDLPPNIEGGTPPPTGFLSLKYQPSGRRFWIEGYTNLAARQSRLSSLDLSDRRTGAPRSRAQIENFFRRGACVANLTFNAAGTCNGNVNGYILRATGENITQVLTRVLGSGFASAPLFRSLPSYALFNVRGGFTINERSKFFVAFENIFDSFHRNPSWGIDGAGRNLLLRYSYGF